MRQYLVERYLPGLRAADFETLRTRIAAAAADLAAEGLEVRYLGSTFVPGEESCFCRFQSDSERAVRRACELADVPFARIHEARDFPTGKRAGGGV
jgi:Nickel responsive protein SCO4226-like